MRAMQSITSQRQPVPGGGHPTIQRDYKYIRHDTLILLAGIDLQTGLSSQL